MFTEFIWRNQRARQIQTARSRQTREETESWIRLDGKVIHTANWR